MKKILLVVDEFLPISTAGAIRLNSFVKELKKKYEVNVLGGDERYLYNNGYDFFDDVEYYTIKRPDDKKVLAPFKFLSYFIRFNLKLIELVKKNNYDLVFVSIPRYEFLDSIVRLGMHTKYVLDIRDLLDSSNYELIFRQFLPVFISRIIAKKFEGRKNILLKKAIAKSTITSLAYKGLYDYYMKVLPEFKSKLVYIPNGVDLENFPKVKKQYSNDKIRLFYLGNFAEKDYLKQIIQVIGRSDIKNKVSFVFVGEGRNKENIMRLVYKYNLDGIFKGRIHHSKVHLVSDEVDIGIILRDKQMPTLLPVSVVEYMAMGLPVIVNDYSELGEFVRESKSGYIIKEVEELPELLKRLIGKNKEFQKLGNYNRSYIERNLDRAKIAKDLMNKVVDKCI